MTDTPPRASRAKLYVPVVIAALLLGGYTALWFWGAGVMRREIAEWTASEREAGREVAYADVRVRGFPGTLRAMIDAPHWSEPGAWAWRAETLIIVTLPYDPSRLIFTPRGEQSVTYGGQDYALRADDLRVSVEEGSVAVQAGTLSAEGGGQALMLGAGLMNWAENDDGTRVMGLSLTSLALTGDGEVDDGDAGAVVLPYLRAAASTVAGETVIEAFQAAVAPSADVDPALMAGEGRIGLDAAGYPAGRIEVRLRNPGPLVTVAAEQGALPADQAATTGSLIASMASADGEVTLPLSMAEGRLRVGFIPVADLPRVGG